MLVTIQYKILGLPMISADAELYETSVCASQRT